MYTLLVNRCYWFTYHALFARAGRTFLHKFRQLMSSTSISLAGWIKAWPDVAMHSPGPLSTHTLIADLGPSSF